MGFETITVTTKNRDTTKQYSRELTRMGLYRTTPFQFSGTIYSRKRMKRIQQYCKEHRLQFRIENELSYRSGNYRKLFFDQHPPDIGKKYICVYCGHLKTRQEITVDHLYPVAAAATNPKLQKKLRRMGIYDINDPKNLVAACETCNKKKGDKIHKWVWKGRIGRHKCIWLLKRFMPPILILVIGYCIASSFIPEIRMEWMYPIYDRIKHFLFI